MIGRHHIHGHAIVSADNKIATPEGTYPQVLYSPADQANFSAALEKAAVTVLGRLGHETDRNPRLRNRLVVSTQAKGIEKRRDGWWWNPAYVSAHDALDAAAPNGGVAAVVGGQRVFDLFLDTYDEFFLSRSERVTIPGGLAIFREVEHGRSPEHVLAMHGLQPRSTKTLDAGNGVTLTVFVRRHA